MRALGMRRVLGFYLLMAGLALAAIYARGDLIESVLPSGLTGLGGWLSGAGLGIATGVTLVVASRLAAAHLAWARQLTEEFRSLVGDLSPREILAIASLSALGEELLFRGLLHPALGLWIGAAVFALLHIGPNRRFLPWTVMAFAVGVLFGLMFDWTGNLLAPILAHFTVNYSNLRHLALGELRTEVMLGSVGGTRAS